MQKSSKKWRKVKGLPTEIYETKMEINSNVFQTLVDGNLDVHQLFWAVPCNLNFNAKLFHIAPGSWKCDGYFKQRQCILASGIVQRAP